MVGVSSGASVARSGWSAVVISTGRIHGIRRVTVALILDLCGGTGAWSQPYTDAGYDVYSVDLKSDLDVQLFESGRAGHVHGILAAPPCTAFAVSGARWWAQKGPDALKEGLAVVDACLRIITVCEPQWWALENPVGRLRYYLGVPVMYFNPNDYGDPYTKKTALWGKFNPPELHQVEPTEGSKMHTRYGGGSGDQRSVTPPGFAQAFFEANP